LSVTAYLRNIVTGERHRLPDHSLTLGRSSKNDCVLNDPKCSRHHATINFKNEKFYFQDHGSKNGSFINGIRVDEKHLIHGDKISIGKQVFLFFREEDHNTLFPSLPYQTMEKRKKTSSTESLESSQILHEALNKKDPFSKLYLFTGQIQGFLDEKQFWRHSTAVFNELLEAEQTYLLSLDGSDEIEISFAASSETSEKILLDHELIEDARQHNRAHLENTEGLSLICLPILGDDSISEILYSFRQENPFTRDDLQLAVALSAQLIAQKNSISLAKRLTQSIEFNHAIQNSLTTGLIVVSSNGVIQRANAIAGDLLGLPVTSLVAQPLGHIKGLHKIENFLAQTLVDGRSFQGHETLIENSEKKNIPVILTCTPILDDSGSLLGAIANFQNQSDIKRLTEEVKRSQQLSALGQMSAGIAHEIRNPLNSIRGFVELICETSPPPEKQKEYFNIILSESDRISGLLQDLLDLAKDIKVPLEKKTFPEILDSMKDLFNMQARQSGIDLIWKNRLEHSLDVLCSSEKLQQVIGNLIGNACEALNNHNAPRLELDLSFDRTKFSRKGALCLDIRDNGSGIDKKNLEKIFTPFFSSKDHGTGLGLAISRKIIDAMNGEIQAFNNDESGATFRILLPVC
jgi:signal transduction histidine kinase